MMETKLWFALCAPLLLLLLVNLGSAEPNNGEVATEAPATHSVSASSLEPITHPPPALNGSDTNPSPSGNSSLSINKQNNDTNIVPPSAPGIPEKNANLTKETRDNHTTTHTPPTNTTTTTTTTTTTSTTTSPPHTAHNTTVNTPSISTANSLAPPTSATTPKPKSETTTSITTSPKSTPSPSTHSSHKTSSPESPTLTSLHTSQSGVPQNQSTKSTITLPSSPTAHTKAQPETPSQLNMGDDTTMVHESPTLDPLLAGLVSAFIITAVIITLLLFLKLRRRDNRPEFRRLQDLPMDDMEDTPLSMYSY